MAKRISARQPSGEVMFFEVTPEMTGRALKQQIKEGQVWDELTRSTTSVEIIIGDNQLLCNDAKALDAGIAEDAVVSGVFKSNKVIWSNKDSIVSLGGIVDSELLPVVELPDDETHILEDAFHGCDMVAKVTISESVAHIGDQAFQHCSSLVNLTIPNSATHIGESAFAGSALQLFGRPDHLKLSDPNWT